MLTARDDETDKLVGLAVGADDYLTKPFSMRELVARVHALLRRVRRAAELASADRNTPPQRIGDLEIDRSGRRVRQGETEVHLTPIEFDLLACLARNPQSVLTREQLLAQVWDWADASGTRTVDSHVKALRRKLGSRPDPHRARNRLRTRDAMTGPRPLDRLQSIKVKLGVLVLASVSVSSLVLWYGLIHLGWLPRYTLPVAVLVALGVTQVLAHGMTSPLRSMTAAAAAMARGDYSRRVRATSRDEVGELARAFNRMAADLEAADTQRRELIANVSHELRTPIAALQAVLENLVDGVAEPQPATMRAALDQTERLGRLVGELLDLSRIDAGTEPINRVDVAVAAVLDAVVDEARMNARTVRFEVEVSPPDAMAWADPARLHQVVANLLDNAAGTAPAGEPCASARPSTPAACTST